MVGILLAIFIKTELAEHINYIEHDSVKQGFAKKFGNKGGVIVRLHLYSTEFCFANIHLPSGSTEFQVRSEALNNILNQAFQREGMAKVGSFARFSLSLPPSLPPRPCLPVFKSVPG